MGNTEISHETLHKMLIQFLRTTKKFNEFANNLFLQKRIDQKILAHKQVCSLWKEWNIKLQIHK